MAENKQTKVLVDFITASEEPKGSGIYNIQKSLVPEKLDKESERSAGTWVNAQYNQYGLMALVDDSTILPQCINAYGNNIAGFGIKLRYKTDEKENSAMSAEWDRAKRVLDLLSTSEPLETVFSDLVKDRETIGIAYLEVIRDGTGDVVQIEHIDAPYTVEMSAPREPYQEYTYYYNGEKVTRRKRFKIYRQTVGAKTVYFKEFGDPRVLNKTNGKYEEPKNPADTANEIIEFKVGNLSYGKVRWIGQTLGVDGARRAEMLNNSYFRKGRHTPLMIILKGGSLTEESRNKLKQYMNAIEGDKGWHGFLVLEAENTDNSTAYGVDEQKKPEIEIKDLASMLQKDELFQDYLNNTRKKVQSAFLLPDLYTGYSTDYNRATAQTAMEVTEKQVFQPERRKLEWTINNLLLNSYDFKYVEAVFNEPDITNPDDVAKILGVTSGAGGVTLNDARDVSGKVMGKTAEPYPDIEGLPKGYGDMPLELVNKLMDSDIDETVGNVIAKAEKNKDDDIVEVLKEIRKALRKGAE